ncbi:MAG: TolC family protein [Gemmatimonadaceae bacterium]|nr:TolC family protein [Gemmatimonadaceae bacterium]
MFSNARRRRRIDPAVAWLALPLALLLLALPRSAARAQAAAASAPAPGQSGEPARTLLDRYVAQAIDANLALAQQGAALRRAEAGVKEANGRFLPSVGLNARYSEFSGVINIGDFINPTYAALNQILGEARFPTDIQATLPFRQETKLDLQMPLFNGALFGARAAARAQRDLVGSTRLTAMRQLAADVQQSWLAVANASRAVETLEAMQPVLDENVRVSERLVSAGQATPDVVLRARAERSELQQQVDDTRRARAAATRGFNLLRNQDAESPVTITSDSTLLALPSLDRDALVAHALRHREELAGAGSGVNLARAQQRVAGSAFLPALSLGASYGVQGDRYRFNNDNDVALASVVLSWNLFNGQQDNARRQQATALRQEAELRVREAERGIVTQVLNALDAVEVARTNLSAANDRHDAAQRAFTLVERRYGEGLATQVEFLSARASYTAAALNRVITHFGFAARMVDLERVAALRTLPH